MLRHSRHARLANENVRPYFLCRSDNMRGAEQPATSASGRLRFLACVTPAHNSTRESSLIRLCLHRDDGDERGLQTGKWSDGVELSRRCCAFPAEIFLKICGGSSFAAAFHNFVSPVVIVALGPTNFGINGLCASRLPRHLCCICR